MNRRGFFASLVALGCAPKVAPPTFVDANAYLKTLLPETYEPITIVGLQAWLPDGFEMPSILLKDQLAPESDGVYQLGAETWDLDPCYRSPIPRRIP